MKLALKSPFGIQASFGHVFSRLCSLCLRWMTSPVSLPVPHVLAKQTPINLLSWMHIVAFFRNMSFVQHLWKPRNRYISFKISLWCILNTNLIFALLYHCTTLSIILMLFTAKKERLTLVETIPLFLFL